MVVFEDICAEQGGQVQIMIGGVFDHGLKKPDALSDDQDVQWWKPQMSAQLMVTHRFVLDVLRVSTRFNTCMTTSQHPKHFVVRGLKFMDLRN